MFINSSKNGRVQSTCFIRIPTQGYQFDNRTIQRMELLLHTTLEWKLSSVTPFAYLSYLVNKFHGESIRPEGLVSKALQHIVVIIKEINSVEHQSSIIAAAASCDERITRKAMELKMDFISLWGSTETEHVFFCYNMMREIEMRKSKTPKSEISYNYSSLCDATENSSATTRRKLTFKESNGNGRPARAVAPMKRLLMEAAEGGEGLAQPQARKLEQLHLMGWRWSWRWGRVGVGDGVRVYVGVGIGIGVAADGGGDVGA
ncbi:formin-like protein 6-like [Hibiscus syriacus]|uniref:Formin-like protein 6-like n=1 Tax=Hibiscus syriacus TaxID=106335 RepID=A0A6A3A9V3_HIBSY|nr:formin-like protein 6-like [Hibiscus syriacus]